MTTTPLHDASVRVQALDTSCSFIVQAPAGSGKTGLLTLRFMRLLALVQHPEEVVALTFTRKAAAEMKNRILEALASGSGQAPRDDFHRQAWTAARAVVERDQALNWGLASNPNRLRILTLDALCSSLSRQMPVLSQLGGTPSITSDPDMLYHLAARTTLKSVGEEGEVSDAIRFLLDHLGNDLTRLESLLADMLSRRDQWLRHVMGRDVRQMRVLMENSLRTLIHGELHYLAGLIARETLAEMLFIARQAAHYREAAETMPEDSSSLTRFENTPEAVHETLRIWQTLASMLLTKEGGWRKSFNKNQGFPAPSSERNPETKKILKENKARVCALIEESLTSQEVFREAFHRTLDLPVPYYTDAQWDTLSALITVLPVAAAHLKLVFSHHRKVDFSEVSQSALLALGESDQPTNLALKLDHQISHLLVDEFQDTSRSQYDLLTKLVAGWEEGGGQTLFVVGDPMQSIYRFREAEVGLFLQARREGIPPVRLIPLTLTTNFRSEGHIVRWVNETMVTAFPKEERIAVGAVPYHASFSYLPESDRTKSVHLHVLSGQDHESEEAGKVAAIAAQARQQGLSVALLVRARRHLISILPALHAAGLRYQAVDLLPLSDQPIIQDLLALTRALIHPADRIAWLAILRAPWCGLSLADLYGLVGQRDPNTMTVWEQITEEGAEQKISADGQKRLARFRQVMTATLRRRGRMDHFPGLGEWRRWIEGCWLALGGAATVGSPEKMEDVRTFFALLEELETEGKRHDLLLLNHKVDKLYAAMDPHADPDLSVMTLHKAKGLEFDVVILPGLGRMTQGERGKLLSWLEYASEDTSDVLTLLAPIGRSDREEADAIQHYIKRIDQEKSRYEMARLLYVAVTRAKKALHLLAGAVEEGKSPHASSFLSVLWPMLAEEFTEERPTETDVALNQEGEETTIEAERLPGGVAHQPHTLYCLKADWRLPRLPAVLEQQENDSKSGHHATQTVRLDRHGWTDNRFRLVGEVVHRYLSRIAKEGMACWSEDRVMSQQKAIQAHLLHLGLPHAALPTAVSQVASALINTLSDERGRWLFDRRHRDAHSEYALSSRVEGQIMQAVVDWCFVDAHDQRWIVDFKTSLPARGEVNAFLDREQVHYQDQLNRYGRLFSQRERRPIRLGLYFPLLPAWREWPYGW